MTAIKLPPACLGLIIFFIYGCTSGNKQPKSKLGEINFSATGKKEAHPNFEKGMLLLHSFEYDDAREEFIKAKSIDPSFTMAYWGEAMTYNHSLWRTQDYSRANQVLQTLGSSPDERVRRAKTEIERDFITGINILYGKGNKSQRDSGYAGYMESLYKKYPGNNEVAAFYSIALIGSVPVGRDVKIYERAAEVAKEVLSRNPRHPGALHYLIHAYDDPLHAAFAYQTANVYSVVAPDAAHALHMPTHIYLALGMWDKVVSSNEVSWAAAQKRKERKNLNNDALSYHAFHWLVYGYLQQGRKDDARKLVDSMNLYSITLPSGLAREHMVYLKTTYLAETNDYLGEVADISPKTEGMNITTRAMNRFSSGMKAFHQNNIADLDEIITQMKGERMIEQERISGNGAGICGNVNSSIPNNLDIQQAEVMEMELKAMQAWLKKDTTATDRLLRQAVDLESGISYAYGPPTIVKPSFELYGEWLLEVNQPHKASEQFDISLKAGPKRALSLKGKQKAEAMMRDNAIAK